MTDDDLDTAISQAIKSCLENIATTDKNALLDGKASKEKTTIFMMLSGLMKDIPYDCYSPLTIRGALF